MKENRKLDNQEIKNVSGGGCGYNKYPKDVYHAAGFMTHYTWSPFDKDEFVLQISDGVISEKMAHNSANKFTDYYVSHTEEEYIKFVAEIFPGYTKIIKGKDF